MPKLKSKTKQPEKVSGEAYCRKCQETKDLNHFYTATNLFLDANGYMSICRDCCNDIYNHYFSIYNDMKKALDYICQDLDVRFSEQVFSQTQSHIEKLISNGKNTNTVFGYYKSKLGSTGKNNEKIDSFRYKDSDHLQEILSEEKDNNNINMIFTKSDFELTEDIVKYWGNNKEAWEYELLEEQMFKLKTDFECPDYGMEMIMKDICFINLDIERIRQGIEKGEITKLIESRSKLMNDGNLKPVQATGADKNEKMSLGVFIKKWENERPITKTLDDEMKRYIDTFMVGHLAKMEGLNNETVRKYEEAIQEYTINFSDVRQYDDEE
ncbi:hypothetical protein [Methanoculleus sp.]|uniref:hypothetical protein n=1 Tax=Methanoculleus sp. TaxID=90427 RepID=UPI0025F0C997|nr:hypothetical protein [Methanoculleus sp.]MCK9319237.1 hypothetical protein [Methanoculleus sp.]